MELVRRKCIKKQKQMPRQEARKNLKEFQMIHKRIHQKNQKADLKQNQVLKSTMDLKNENICNFRFSLISR